MKLIVLSLFVALASSLPASPAGHGHSHGEKKAGPNGGRLLTVLDPHAEFFVTADRKVQITFLDVNDKPVAPSGQLVTVTTGDRAAPTKLTFTRSGDVLISDAALPAGSHFPTVVQIKTSAEAKLLTEKFNVDLSVCSGCSLAEYACICGH